MAPKGTHDLFLKFVVSVFTASAVKLALDVGEIKTTVAVAVERIETLDMRLRSVEERIGK